MKILVSIMMPNATIDSTKVSLIIVYLPISYANLQMKIGFIALV